VQRPHPRIIVGGGGGPRSIAAAARWGDEYNVAGRTAADCRALRGRLDAACERHGRDRQQVNLSFMAATLIGRDRSELRERTAVVLRRRHERPDVHRFLATTGAEWFAGTVDEVAARIRELETAGVRRVYLQQVLHDDLEMVRLAGEELIPRVA
jgi:alkanesulfonate monooxygenase SsuD/methylene tetrahydromethanopterin reductase-like flavin-dependent oxidoreductase (luciferase family)